MTDWELQWLRWLALTPYTNRGECSPEALQALLDKGCITIAPAPTPLGDYFDAVELTPKGRELCAPA